ncbi:hypothetical protein AB0E01_22865 [Nocardia vinacea]|uniref:hypothetical protein n=1 Tax=Nocardia vinacea TaxID=96468 RepID=UPI0033D70EBC
MTDVIDDDERQPRRSRLAPGVWMLDYLNGYIEAVDDDGDVIATANRFSPALNSANFTGWVVRRGSDYSDPIRTKKAAVERLRDWATNR